MKFYNVQKTETKLIEFTRKIHQMIFFFIFKELRNKTQTMIYTAKRDYFKEKVENENTDSKSL